MFSLRQSFNALAAAASVLASAAAVHSRPGLAIACGVAGLANIVWAGLRDRPGPA